ncbi:MAG: hypothetical protein B9S33_04410 [Pedosphaera sp. Tous-C6FEB]|nr:MAG: hypothetical protein B9S33_04410 [Pedosphaera sp. Tous-C6FEB]
MKYHLLKPDGFITGPFELESIKAQLKAGEISPDTLATGDIGESLGQVRSTPAQDWMPVRAIPGFGPERAPESAPLAAADEVRFCPGCAHQLATPLPPGEAGVCERCGRTLGFAPPPPPPPVPTVTLLPIGGSKSGRVLAGTGKVLGGLFLTLLLLGGGLLFFGFLLLILVGSKCRA